MSLFARVDFAICLTKFRNIDLFQSGYYRIRCRLYFLDDDVTYTAYPTKIAYKKKGELRWENIQEDGTILTRPFLIRFIDDVADLNETIGFNCQVRLKVSNFGPFTSFFRDLSSKEVSVLNQNTLFNGHINISPFFLEVDLLHCELPEITLIPDLTTISDDDTCEKIENYPCNDEFTSVCYNVYRINNVSSGIIEYVPVLFDEFHFCHLNCIIISQVTGIFASNDEMYSNNRTRYPVRFNRVKPLPTIPSFLLSKSKADEKSEENEQNDGDNPNNDTKKLDETKSGLKKKLPINRNVFNSNIKVFNVRSAIVQKMSELNNNSKANNLLSSMEDKKTASSEHGTVIKEKELLNNNVEYGYIGLDEVFPKVIKRDPVFTEACKLRVEMITALTSIYLQLAANMHFITRKCCTPQRIKLIGSYFTIPPLELPGGSRLNVEPLVDINNLLFDENGASVPFYVMREPVDSSNEKLFTRVGSDIQLKEESEFKHSLTIASDGTTIGTLPEQRLEDLTLNYIKLPPIIWSLTPLNWQLDYKRGITPPLFKRSIVSQSISIDPLLNNEPISHFHSLIDAPYGITQYCTKLNEEISDLSTQLLDTWNRVLAILPFVIGKLEQICKMENIRKTMYLWNETVFIENLSSNELHIPNPKPEPAKFPEYVQNNNFPITPPISLFITSSSPVGEEQMLKKSTSIMSVIPNWVTGPQNMPTYNYKPIDYYSKTAFQLRTNSVFKSIPSPTAIEEICLPPIYESPVFEDQQNNNNVDNQGNSNEKTTENNEDMDYSEIINSSKYNEWLPILFIQKYTKINNKPYTGGILTHCGQLCRVGLNNDPATNARYIINKKIMNENIEKKTFTVPKLFESNNNGNDNCSNGTADTGNNDFAPIIPIKTELPFSSEDKASEVNIRDLHIIVFVHGLQGSAFDMRNVRNIISLYYPDVLCLLSTCNEENTDGPIEDMGKRLSEEVISAITPFSKTIKKLSFIGHSLGGVIIRAALPHLKMFSEYFYLYWSLSTPHLGCVSNNSKLINVGVWIMKKWSSSQSLNQLSLSDSQKYEDTFMYKLATKHSEHLSHFKHVVFCSSHQDMYAPYDSARAEYNSNAPSVYKDMVESILKHIDPGKLIRVDVNFYLPQKNLDTFIGRAAHIQVIENHLFVKILVTRFPEWFIV
ncbi:ZW18 protein [Cryptosporidium ryanae]|uniref:ZW18 protein n=1 Tax=Cryptosporidium ryanae TaxID=515981 RepID=UPI00351A5215|nr:ZW18 protein [Cryptosporidium ryanae]